MFSVEKWRALTIFTISNSQTPQKAGFRAVVISPTRELAQQTYREFCRLSAGSGFKVHVLTKAKANANSFGPQSTQRFGEANRELCMSIHLHKNLSGVQVHNHCIAMGTSDLVQPLGSNSVYNTMVNRA